MNEKHQANKRWWNKSSPEWKKRREKEWKQCITNPSLGFPRGSFDLLQKYAKELKNKEVCVLGSGDNFSSFVLASLGANVTSVDISKEQLDTAAERAQKLNLNIKFLQSDATKIPALENNSFDFVCSTNGFYIWIADIKKLFSEIYRILKPNGFFMSFDIHPFLRPWKNRIKEGIIEMDKPYFHETPLKSYYVKETGKFEDSNQDIQEKSEERFDVVYEHHWTLNDLLNPLFESGLILQQILEEPAEEDFFLDEVNSDSTSQIDLLDWRSNPKIGLPAWLTLVAQKKS